MKQGRGREGAPIGGDCGLHWNQWGLGGGTKVEYSRGGISWGGGSLAEFVREEE